MYRIRKNILPAIIAVVLLVVAIPLYRSYIQREIYRENSSLLMTTYTQVNQTFTMFAQRNWSVLTDFGISLHCLQESQGLEHLWQSWNERKNSWQYSDFYLFNEECDFLTVSGRKGNADSIENVFQKMYEQGEPVIATYTASNGEYKFVFAAPLKQSFTLDNVTYTGIAVSYDTEEVEGMLSARVYEEDSTCYVVDAAGNTVLSLKPRYKGEPNPGNIFEFIQNDVSFIEGNSREIQNKIQLGEKADGEFEGEMAAYYLVSQPMGINDWSIVAIVNKDAVDSRSESLISLTIVIITALAACIMILIILSLRFWVEQDRKQHKALESMANTDGLTGLFNERKFSFVLHEKEKKKESFVLYYLDLDHFKPVNDTYGHDMGDKLLKEVAGRLQQCIRGGDCAFCIGGDEFALIVSGDLDENIRQVVKERIVESLLKVYEIDGQVLHIGASCGYAAYPEEGESADGIRILADQRMYAEKEINHQKAKDADNR